MYNAYEFHINNSPLIVMTPHSGRNYSNRFLKYMALDLKDLRNTEDYFIDQLFFPFRKRIERWYFKITGHQCSVLYL